MNLSVVIPVYGSEAILPDLAKRLAAVLPDIATREPVQSARNTLER